MIMRSAANNAIAAGTYYTWFVLLGFFRVKMPVYALRLKAGCAYNSTLILAAFDHGLR